MANREGDIVSSCSLGSAFKAVKDDTKGGAAVGADLGETVGDIVGMITGLAASGISAIFA